MDPITLALIGASIGGGILQAAGGKKAKSISPEWLKKHFGPDAVTEEMIALFNQIINSPQGQQLMTSAAEQGAQFETDVARRSAAAGMGPAGGAESGASIFSGAAAGGATAGLQRGVRANVMQHAGTMAQQNVNARMAAAAGSEQARLAGDFSQPSTMQMLGGAISQGAAAGLAATPTSAVAPRATTTPYSVNSPTGGLPASPEEGLWNAASSYQPRPRFWSRLASRFAGRQPQMVTHGAQR